MSLPKPTTDLSSPTCDRPSAIKPPYCLGFAFSESLEHVLLLQRDPTKPVGGGMWNGLGGSVEAGEDAREAMLRELQEEAGLDLPASEWMHVGAFERPMWHVDVFAARTDAIFQARQMEKEVVKVWRVEDFVLATVQEPEKYAGLESAWLVPYIRRLLTFPDRHNHFLSASPEALTADMQTRDTARAQAHPETKRSPRP